MHFPTAYSSLMELNGSDQLLIHTLKCCIVESKLCLTTSHIYSSAAVLITLLFRHLALFIGAQHLWVPFIEMFSHLLEGKAWKY